MQAFRFFSLALLSALLASSAVLYAQDEKPQDEKPPRQEEPKKKDEAKPPHQDEVRPPKQDKREQQQESHGQMKPEKRDHAEPQARPTKSARIPDDKFRSNFGRSHSFTVNKVVVVEGQPRFQYSGYTFVLVDAWPVDWAYTDDCYIDYIDGEYFLFDLFHPGVRAAVFVVM
ncbi:MAG: hypothetical protein WCA16_07845 [Candidatus Sulfotelmatobacter sp.]